MSQTFKLPNEQIKSRSSIQKIIPLPGYVKRQVPHDLVHRSFRKGRKFLQRPMTHLRRVTWRDKLLPGWKKGAERVFPWVGVGLLLLPFLTVEKEGFGLLVTGKGDVLGAWDIPCLYGNPTRPTRYPWTSRSPAVYDSFFSLPMLTTLSPLFFLCTTAQSYRIWHERTSNLTRESNGVVESPSIMAICFSLIWGVIFWFYWRWFDKHGANIGGVRLDTGSYCALLAPVLSAAWWGYATWKRRYLLEKEKRAIQQTDETEV